MSEREEHDYQVEVGFRGVGWISVKAASKSDAMRKVRDSGHEEWDDWQLNEVYPRSATRV